MAVRKRDAADIHVNDITPITNPLQQADMARALHWAPYARRPHIAIAWVGISLYEWCDLAGLDFNTARNWIHQIHPMPYGGAMRLAKVLGLSVEELFGGGYTAMPKKVGPKPGERRQGERRAKEKGRGAGDLDPVLDPTQLGGDD